jgi:hypothetical protein
MFLSAIIGRSLITYSKGQNCELRLTCVQASQSSCRSSEYIPFKSVRSKLKSSMFPSLMAAGMSLQSQPAIANRQSSNHMY